MNSEHVRSIAADEWVTIECECPRRFSGLTVQQAVNRMVSWHVENGLGSVVKGIIVEHQRPSSEITGKVSVPMGVLDVCSLEDLREMRAMLALREMRAMLAEASCGRGPYAETWERLLRVVENGLERREE